VVLATLLATGGLLGCATKDVPSANLWDLVMCDLSTKGPDQYLYTGNKVEEKVFCNVTLEHDFADNVVLIVLNIQASTLLDIVGSKVSLKTYTPSDFPEINCVKVSELTLCVTEQINAKLATIKFQNLDDLANIVKQMDWGYDIQTLNRIFALELGETGKENVLAAIKTLEKRDDILGAGPNGFTSIQ
jgi:hypothetical protein